MLASDRPARGWIGQDRSNTALSNASADTPRLRLAQMQGQRYWVERTFEDAKGECGLRRSSGTGMAAMAFTTSRW